MKKNLLYISVPLFFCIVGAVSAGANWSEMKFVFPILFAVALGAFLLLKGRDLFFNWLHHPTPLYGYKNWIFIIGNTAGLIGMIILFLRGILPYYIFLLFTILVFPQKSKN